MQLLHVNLSNEPSVKKRVWIFWEGGDREHTEGWSGALLGKFRGRELRRPRAPNRCLSLGFRGFVGFLGFIIRG